MKLIFSFFALTFFYQLPYAFAASCCGGGFAIPSLITGDDKAQVTTSFSQAQVDTDVFSSGVWQKRSTEDITQTYKLDYAHIFADRFQYGFSLPIESRQNHVAGSDNKESGLGDVSLQLGYEYLPDWDYNPWRPKGVGFISLVIPTAPSIYEVTNEVESRGRGFYSLGAGTVLTKTWLNWDANANFEAHHSFTKVVNDPQTVVGNIVPGNGASFGFGGGYSFGDTRVGSSVTWTFEDPINVESASTPSSGAPEKYATGTLSLSQMFNQDWAASLSLSDQTLFGDPSNAVLSKSVALSLQKRWQR